MKSRQQAGFTIVELLIVIVVIAILVAITIVAYNGIQQRARNTATINAASTSLRLIQAYIAQTGEYPWTAGGGSTVCITTNSGCHSDTDIPGNVTFDSKMATIGTLPRSVATADNYYGIYLTYASNTTYNGVPAPLRMTYFLSGTNQNCDVSGISQYVYPAYVSSTTGYTYGNLASSGRTLCWVSIPGPAM